MNRREEVLLHRWRQLLPGHEDVGRDLLRRYAEPGRVYHDQQHLAQILIMVDRLATGAEDRRVVRLAAWFHDAVYETAGSDNEDASALLATDRLTRAGEATATVAEVARLVRLTTRHDAGPDDPNGAVLCDADMAILAAGEQRYARYAAAIRCEHAELDDGTYAAGRSSFLRSLLGARLFVTEAGRGLEGRARINITAELARLRG